MGFGKNKVCQLCKSSQKLSTHSYLLRQLRSMHMCVCVYALVWFFSDLFFNDYCGACVLKWTVNKICCKNVMKSNLLFHKEKKRKVKRNREHIHMMPLGFYFVQSNRYQTNTASNNAGIRQFAYFLISPGSLMPTVEVVYYFDECFSLVAATKPSNTHPNIYALSI